MSLDLQIEFMCNIQNTCPNNSFILREGVCGRVLLEDCTASLFFQINAIKFHIPEYLYLPFYTSQ